MSYALAETVYCARGDSGNRLKELKLALAFGRTSCTRFWAKQLRITLTAAAFVLWQELQLRTDQTALRGAQVPRLRQALITIGVHVLCPLRRIVLHFPRFHPDAATWTRLARARGAVPAGATGHVVQTVSAVSRRPASSSPPLGGAAVAETRSLMDNAG